jgi:hypothetical protein
MATDEFTTYDLKESLDCAERDGHGSEVKIGEVASVLAAWGVSGREYADFTGGFLLALKDGRFAYVEGWSDSSGWG